MNFQCIKYKNFVYNCCEKSGLNQSRDDFWVKKSKICHFFKFSKFYFLATKPTGFFDSLANFFDKYQQLILALLVVCLSAILLFSGFRLGLLTANQTRPPTYMSPIQQDGMEGSFGRFLNFVVIFYVVV